MAIEVNLPTKTAMKPTINWDKLKEKNGGKWKKRVTKPIGKTKTV